MVLNNPNQRNQEKQKGLWHPADPSLEFKWTYTALTRSEKNLFFPENYAIR